MTDKHLIATLILAAACGKPAGAPAPSVTQADADAINALVPAALKTQVQFEVGTILDDFGHHKTTYTLVLPKGWKKGFMPGSLEPADSDNFGSKTLGKTSIQVGNNCDGDCKDKDWAAVVDKVYYRQYTSGQVTGKLVKDDKRATGRTLVFHQEPKTEKNGDTEVTSGQKATAIITTWWVAGAPHHFVCKVELGEAAAGLEAAFGQACAKVAIAE